MAGENKGLVPTGDGLMYRLHRLAEIGYCAEFGRYSEGREIVRLHHPEHPKFPELTLDADGMLDGEVNFGGGEPYGIMAENGSDRARFESFVNKLGPGRIGRRSRFVYEVRMQFVGFIVLFVIGAVGWALAGWAIAVSRLPTTG